MADKHHEKSYAQQEQETMMKEEVRTRNNNGWNVQAVITMESGQAQKVAN
jgi:hypothetical protein